MSSAPAPIEWVWSESGVSRRTVDATVRDKIYWSYAVLILTRQLMERGNIAAPNGRGRATPRVVGMLQRGELRIGTIEKEDKIKALADPICAHCGTSEARTMDHLIPRSRGGQDVGFNTVTCCGHCNSSRRNVDLCRWYRQRQRFPTLALLRHYLKLCERHSHSLGLLDVSVEKAAESGLPFDPLALPTKFPPVEKCVLDWRSI